MDFRENLNNASMELKIAIFCGLCSIACFVYSKVEPTLMEYVLRILVPTSLLSIIVYFYKIIFGSLKSVVAIILMISAYIALISMQFNFYELQKFSWLISFFCVIVQTFIFIFLKKKKVEENEEKKSINTKYNILPVALAITLFLIEGFIYSSIVNTNANSNLANDILNNDKANLKVENNIQNQNNKVMEVAEKTNKQESDYKNNIKLMQNVVDNLGYTKVQIIATSYSQDKNKSLSLTTTNGNRKGFLIYNGNNLAWVNYSNKVHDFLDKKQSDDIYKPVTFVMSIWNDNKDKDEKLGTWIVEDGISVHSIGIHAIFEVVNGKTVVKKLATQKGLGGSNYLESLTESKNVEMAKTFITEMQELNNSIKATNLNLSNFLK